KAISIYNQQHPTSQIPAGTKLDFSNEAPVKNEITTTIQQASDVALRIKASNAIIGPAPVYGTLAKVTNPNITPFTAIAAQS
ncbi:MAG TPA: hypothetical protein VH144_01075, partial [Candidatus Saccharimonadales bacterium]|nr:hypothetical protein [Candidatus Saccharimonadales bacterium]